MDRVSQLPVCSLHLHLSHISPSTPRPMHGAMMRSTRGGRGLSALLPLFFVALLLLARPAAASVGDQLPEFKECVEVRFPECPRNKLP